MSYLFNLVYLSLLLLLGPWFVYTAVRKGKYREGFAEKFWGRTPLRQGDKTCFWFHAVSVGEVNLIAGLVGDISRDRSDRQCVISTTTMTGFALAKKKYPDHLVFYCPLDFSWAVRRAMRRIRPDVLVLAELELWPNLIRAAEKFGAKVAIVNGRLGDSSYRGYRRIRFLIRRLLRSIDLLAVQNEQYQQRFMDLGALPSSLHVTGSLKFDGAQTDRQNESTRHLAALAAIADEDQVFLAGSTQEPEEALALETFQKLSADFPRLRLIIVPRHPDRFAEVEHLLRQSGVRFQLRSRLETERGDRQARVLLVDAIGELGAWWGTAQIAFVGGSMGRRGGQNMIEPAAYGATISFGPNTHNFRDTVKMLLDAEAAEVVHDGSQLTDFVQRSLANPGLANQRGQRASRLVARQLGAKQRMVDLLVSLVESTEEPASHRVDFGHENRKPRSRQESFTGKNVE